jgi:hypothetical protein
VDRQAAQTEAQVSSGGRKAEVSPEDFGGEGRRRARFPQEQDRFLREEERDLLRDEDRQLLREDDRGLAVARVDGNCAEHPERKATAACTECRRQLCPQCVYAAGGGHAFCKECMEASRLVDAEPKIIGQVVETQERVAPRTAMLALLIVLAVAALLVVGLILAGLLRQAGV